MASSDVHVAKRLRTAPEQRPEHIPTISYNALRRARTTIEDFVKSYLPYHDLTTEDFLSKYWDTLVYVEGTIYQMDEANEESVNVEEEAEEDSWEVLLAVLRELDILDDRIRSELEKGKEYWHLERQICQQLAATPSSQGDASGALSLEQVHKASANKSFDYRVLNLLMYKLTSKPHDENQLAFLAVDEQLVDIGDDLYDYEDDVVKNSFNIYRAYVALYGRDAQMRLIEQISQLERQHEQLLSKLPADFQAKFRQRHKQASAEPGSGNWVFPPPIFDEALFRARHADDAD